MIQMCRHCEIDGLAEENYLSTIDTSRVYWRQQGRIIIQVGACHKPPCIEAEREYQKRIV